MLPYHRSIPTNQPVTKPALNAGQKQALQTIQRFLDHHGPDTFVLKGYAGTGKTFLMQTLAKWLKEQNRSFCLLASTGRAAAVLRGKTGFPTRTVHGELYQFSQVEGNHDHLQADDPAEKFGEMQLQFVLRKPDEVKRVYIVDEASMLSSEAADDAMASFGSGQLMNDFFDGVGNNKVIFVGDPCQLPPVGQGYSPALDMDWLSVQQRTAISVTLETIERTQADNDILSLAGRIREMIDRPPETKWPKIPASRKKDVKVFSSDEKLFDAYVARFRANGNQKTLAIARSNAMVKEINTRFRRVLFASPKAPLQVSDVLLLNRNNYKVGLTNGDFVKVLAVGAIVSRAGLQFQSVQIRSLASDTDFDVLVSLDVLYGENSQFGKEQNTALMVDFTKRMKGKNIKPNTAAYKEAMRLDDYLNCLQATYGYAVTCHKAQGGEWDDIFLFLDKGMYGMPRAELFRWWYTAITRARKELNLAQGWWIE